MTDVTYSGNELQIGETTIELRREIKSVVECDDVVLVVMKVPATERDDTNVVAFDYDGARRWEIDEAPHRDNIAKTYVKLDVRDGSVIARSWNSYEYEVDLETGSVESVGKWDK